MVAITNSKKIILCDLGMAYTPPGRSKYSPPVAITSSDTGAKSKTNSHTDRRLR